VAWQCGAGPFNIASTRAEWRWLRSVKDTPFDDNDDDDNMKCLMQDTDLE